MACDISGAPLLSQKRLRSTPPRSTRYAALLSVADVQCHCEYTALLFLARRKTNSCVWLATTTAGCQARAPSVPATPVTLTTRCPPGATVQLDVHAVAVCAAVTALRVTCMSVTPFAALSQVPVPMSALQSAKVIALPAAMGESARTVKPRSVPPLTTVHSASAALVATHASAPLAKLDAVGPQ